MRQWLYLSLFLSATSAVAADHFGMLDKYCVGGLKPIDYAAGRYARAFLEPEPKSWTETSALLRGYITGATGREPKESKRPRPTQTRGTGRTEQALAR